MSRVIKLRVHCADSGKVLAYEHFNTTLNWGYYWVDALLPEDDRVCETRCYFKHPHPLGRLNRVQFTGLYDKNGVEIYEGDFISDTHFIWEVIFNVDSWVCNLISHYNSKINNETLSNIIRARSFAKMPVKVIGNIYENKELL